MNTQKESTEERIEEAKKMITGAREDIKNHWSGNSDARKGADEQLSAALGYLQENIQSDDNRIRESITDARTTIGTFFNDLQAITNQTYSSTADQLQAGECNLSI